MKNDQITAQYLKYRAQLHDQLVSLEQQIPALISRRDELKDLLYGELKTNFDVVPAKKVSAKRATKKTTTRKAVQKKTGATVTLDVYEEELLGFLKDNPGASRADIRTALNGRLSETALSNLLSRLSGRKVIANLGTRPSSRWHLVEVEKKA